MKHPFNFLQLDNGAALLFTPCPGTQQVELKTSLAQLVEAGASAVLTLMPSEEMERNQVTDLPNFCAELKLQWFHLPIEDDHAPEQEFNLAWQANHKKIHALLKNGHKLVIHCKGGTGRTGLVAAQILLERGLMLDEVVDRVRSIRPKALKIPAHLAYIQQLSKSLVAAQS